ncbi:hypothetical protein [Aureimonas sp. ME7]|uniref:hypothetical protein n=1 Tax=Aureimonas sp. ME7 TaxID=2744252 RepID=UPI0015F3AFC8|nr:hypothetical protein [Aureimonas sp. ME7]
MRLIAWALRLIGCLVLAIGTIFAVGDIARSLASNRTVLMTIEEAAQTIGMPLPSNGPPAQAASGVFASDGRGATLNGALGRQPASVVFGMAGIVLLALGRPGRRIARN